MKLLDNFMQVYDNGTQVTFFHMNDKQNGLIQVNVKPDFESFPNPKENFVEYKVAVYVSNN